MGLIKAALGAAGGVMADQWKEYFYCEAISENVMAVKGQHRVSGRSSNYKGSENIISNGSVVAVADGQCMIIVDQGKVTELCAEPGEFVYDSSTEPSIFSGELGSRYCSTRSRTLENASPLAASRQRIREFTISIPKSLSATSTELRRRFRFVLLTSGPALTLISPFAASANTATAFATRFCSTRTSAAMSAESYTRDRLDGQLKTELLTALQPAFAKISDMGIRYSALPGHTMELADALNEVLSGKWRNLRGLEIVSFGVSSVKAERRRRSRCSRRCSATRRSWIRRERRRIWSARRRRQCSPRQPIRVQVPQWLSWV